MYLLKHPSVGFSRPRFLSLSKGNNIALQKDPGPVGCSQSQPALFSLCSGCCDLPLENNQIDSLLETKDGHLGATASAKMTDIPLPTRSAAKSTKLIGCKSCLDGWVSHGAKCYFFSNDAVNWTHSRDHCVSMGGHLVIINSQQEQTFLRSMNVNSWIGLNDFETEGWWLWVDNKPLSQTGVNFWIKWGGGVSEPNNSKKDDPSGENCARLSNPEGYSGWVDAPCGELHAFVCEGLSVN
ncbi:CD209 antigen-like protein C isoform X3 [Esox lucius]|uniref:CD209 antigen-like protein C isoform X3 n=1 Tax=Esox lucius TaxID=8010 RepID=UPI0014769159|nr:CD209 antigen-like protein C isoform X3 [Esox lucius]